MIQLQRLQADDTIVVTGAAGFIGSYLCGLLNRLGFNRLILVDDFNRPEKHANLEGKQYLQQIERDQFMDWTRNNPATVRYVFHLGARTDTTEMDYEVHRRLNLEYSKDIWQWCSQEQIPLVYASSAATYGDGALGYQDRHDVVSNLKPLNPYGRSKNDFDRWALAQAAQPPFWAGVKFFNVYGPNEYHKGRMASVIFHAFNQIKNQGYVRLFRSHHPDYKDGEQIRDFIYVHDIVHICLWLMDRQPESGLYNAGTGHARTFKDLATGLFKAMGHEPDIRFVDTPEDIRDKYQYFTEADMSKLLAAGYDLPFYSLEDGINEYYSRYLAKGLYF